MKIKAFSSIIIIVVAMLIVGCTIVMNNGTITDDKAVVKTSTEKNK